MVLQELAQVLQREMLLDMADFATHPEKHLKENEDGVEETKESKEESKNYNSDNNKNRKRKVCVCGFDSEQCEHVVSV